MNVLPLKSYKALYCIRSLFVSNRDAPSALKSTDGGQCSVLHLERVFGVPVSYLIESDGNHIEHC